MRTHIRTGFLKTPPRSFGGWWLATDFGHLRKKVFEMCFGGWAGWLVARWLGGWWLGGWGRNDWWLAHGWWLGEKMLGPEVAFLYLGMLAN